MPDATNQPPLKPLHPDTSLSPAKLAMFEKWSSEALRQSLVPGQTYGLKARPDGTILDGHHRIHVLRGRQEEVDELPREILDVAHEQQEERLAWEQAEREAQQQEHDQEQEQSR